MPVLRNGRLLFGISIAALVAIGGLTYWIVTSLLPPRQVVAFVRLLNGPEADFYNALQAPRDGDLKRSGDWRNDEVESFRRFRSRGQGPWQLTWWERSKFGNRFGLIVVDGGGNRSHLDLIMTVPGRKIGAVQYWPFVKGKTLDE